MKTSALLSTLALFAASAGATTVSVSYDRTYDNGATSLNTVSCSNGPHGLEPRFTTFGSLPHFPNIGGAAAIAGFGSPNCGTCWRLSFQGRSINVLAIDHAATGFNIAFAALNTLTNGQAEFLGRINADAVQVAASACGL